MPATRLEAPMQTVRVGSMEYPPTSLLYFLQGATAPVILEAFKRDCAQLNIRWDEEKGQRLATDLFLNHPLSSQYPPRRRVLQSFLKLYISSIEQQYAIRKNSDDRPDTEEEDPIFAELLTAHIDLFLNADIPEPTMCYKSFLNFYAPLSCVNDDASGRPAAALIGASAEDYLQMCQEADETNNVDDDVLLSVRRRPPTSSSQPVMVPGARIVDRFVWNTIKVASDTFKNVGLSLWPAAFALVQLLSQEFNGESSIIPTITKATPHSLRIVELGAGVGLTPCVLATQPGFEAKTRRFCATDYQVELLDNMRKNFWLNEIKESDTPGMAETEKISFLQKQFQLESARGKVMGGLSCNGEPPLPSAQGDENIPSALPTSVCRRRNRRDGTELDESNVAYSMKLLDWNELDVCESLFSVHGSDLLLAADCIYDVSVVPALVSVIHAGLQAPSVEDLMREESIRRQRNNNINSSRTSLPENGSQTGKVGLTPSPPPPTRSAVVVQTHRQNSTMKVFFDAVRERGLDVKSYRLVQVPLADARRLVKIDPERYIPLDSWPRQTPPCCAFSPDDTLVCLLTPDVVLPDGSLESLNPVGAGKSANTTELIRDGFIGPYYVSMIGLLGVHIITKKD